MCQLCTLNNKHRGCKPYWHGMYPALHMCRCGSRDHYVSAFNATSNWSVTRDLLCFTCRYKNWNLRRFKGVNQSGSALARGVASWGRGLGVGVQLVFNRMRSLLLNVFFYSWTNTIRNPCSMVGLKGGGGLRVWDWFWERPKHKNVFCRWLIQVETDLL